MAKPKALYILDRNPYEWIYGPAERTRMNELLDIYAPLKTAGEIGVDPSLLQPVEVILSGWGCITFTADVLAAAPHLKAVFYGAGSVRSIVTEAFWQRGIKITSAVAGNAVPVAEYTLSQILFGLKSGWQHVLRYKHQRHYERFTVAGSYGSTVGLISLGTIGRMVAERLRGLDVQVIAYDPFVAAADASRLGVELVTLDEVFQRSDVVSLHTPNLPETRGMITGAHFAAMKPFSTFINTARGAVVREAEMVEVLVNRPDLFAVLDVTDPEPVLPDSPLFTLPNVILTPHIAGAMQSECRRMGRLMADEVGRYVAEQPLVYGLTRERAVIMA